LKLPNFFSTFTKCKYSLPIFIELDDAVITAISNKGISQAIRSYGCWELKGWGGKKVSGSFVEIGKVFLPSL
jgi:hypothetical protein